MRVRVGLSMAWVDPVEGPVRRDRVLELGRAVRDAGATEFTLCDTYGGASPADVASTLSELFALFPREAMGLHLHDTFGVAGANTLAGLGLGLRRFEGSIGGLGGCPFAPGARGNMATEDLVYLLHSLGTETGVDLDALRRAKEECLSMLATGRGLPRRIRPDSAGRPPALRD
jgi:hydroxymethylglutaryl-CoA lyase